MMSSLLAWHGSDSLPAGTAPAAAGRAATPCARAVGCSDAAARARCTAAAVGDLGAANPVTRQVGRSAGMVWGASTKPGLALGPLLSGQRLEGDPRPAGTRALDVCMSAASYGLAYSPGGDASSQHGRFTMALELIEERKLSVAFLYHMAVQRNVHNPFEGSGERARALCVGGVRWGVDAMGPG